MNHTPGRVAFITGGASGIGLGMAQAFAENGIDVAIADINEGRLESALATLRATGARAHAVRLDVTDRDAYARAAEEAEAELGKVHILCNNAGIGILGSLADASYDDWDWILGVNLGGVINGLQTFLPRIRRHGQGGHIVSTASAAGLFAGSGAGIYTASKMAVVGMMECLRGDLAAEGIGVSVLCPHVTRTNIHEHGRLRPEQFGTTRYEPPAEVRAQIERSVRSLVDLGMDPVDVGRRVLEGIRRNDLYILTHPEIEAPIRERFEAILSAIPDEPADAARVAAEAASLHYWVYTEGRRD